MKIDLIDPKLGGVETEELPCFRLSKFEYQDMQGWNKEGVLPSEPLPLLLSAAQCGLYGDRAYWGVKQAASKRIPLNDIRADHVEEKMFGRLMG